MKFIVKLILEKLQCRIKEKYVIVSVDVKSAKFLYKCTNMISWCCHTVFRQKERKHINGYAGHSILQASLQQDNVVVNYQEEGRIRKNGSFEMSFIFCLLLQTIREQHLLDFL